MFRLRPASDLLSRVILHADAPSIAHLGCADGVVSQLLRDRWLSAPIRCIDPCARSLAKAEERLARPAEFVCDAVDAFALAPAHHSYDLIFSDGALHASPSLPADLERLLERVRPGGSLALYFPLCGGAALPDGHALLRQAVASQQLLGELRLPPADGAHVDPSACMARLRGPLCSELDMWSTRYMARVSEEEPVGQLSLAPLDARASEALTREYLRLVGAACPKQADGSSLLELSYTFVVARRPGLMDIYTDYAAYHDHQLTKGWKS